MLNNYRCTLWSGDPPSGRVFAALSETEQHELLEIAQRTTGTINAIRYVLKIVSDHTDHGDDEEDEEVADMLSSIEHQLDASRCRALAHLVKKG